MTARRNIRGDQSLDIAVAKGASTRSRWLCDLLPWIVPGAMPAWIKLRTTLSAPCLVRVKIRARSIGLLPQHVDEDRRLGAAIDADDALLDALDRRGDRRHGDLDRVAQHLRGEFGDGAQAWWPRTSASAVPGRQLGNDLADVVDEAHVEHPVGFIEHENSTSPEAKRIAL